MSSGAVVVQHILPPTSTPRISLAMICMLYIVSVGSPISSRLRRTAFDPVPNNTRLAIDPGDDIPKPLEIVLGMPVYGGRGACAVSCFCSGIRRNLFMVARY